MNSNNALLWKAFFANTTVGELKHFRAALDSEQPVQRALGRYIDSWQSSLSHDHGTPFEPRAYVSDDLSSALYHSSPCIFMGSNSWAVAATTERPKQESYLSFLAARIQSIREYNPDAVMVVSVVPEKDYTISRMFESETDEIRELTESMLTFKRILAAHDIHLIFDEYLEGLSKYQSIADYDYPDSHLPTANYLQIFARQLSFVGIPWENVEKNLLINAQPEYLDMVDKLQLGFNNPVQFALPQMNSSHVKLIGGSETFGDPLGDTVQVLLNEAPMDEREILILGDSHSSIYGRKKLTYLLANIFSKTTFNWNPCGFREEITKVPYPIIFLEVTQRFLYRP